MTDDDQGTRFLATLEDILKARERERSLPLIGSPERPYEMIVPGWVEDRARAEGTTCQEIADRLFSVSVDVTVVRGEPQ